MAGDGGKEKEDAGDNSSYKEEPFRSAARVKAGGKIVAKRAPEPRGGLLEQYPRDEYDREKNLYVRQYLCNHGLNVGQGSIGRQKTQTTVFPLALYIRGRGQGEGV